MKRHQEERVSFVASLACMACAGTLYLFSAYAQDLARTLHLSQTEINIVASMGGLGLYISGPAMGYLADTYRVRPLIAASAMLLLLGYSGMASTLLFEFEFESISYFKLKSIMPLVTLALCYFLVGLGSAGVFNGTLSTNVKNFKPSDHGLSIGVSVAFFGLSALLFSQLSILFMRSEKDFDDAMKLDSFKFLLFVGGVTGVVPLLASLFLLEPPKSQELLQRNASSSSSFASDNLPQADSPSTLRNNNVETVPAESPVSHSNINDASNSRSSSSDTDTSTLSSDETQPLLAPSSGELEAGEDKRVRSKGLSLPLYLFNLDAFLLFIAFILASGPGLMYINNVGSIVDKLGTATGASQTDILASRRLQVSLISLFNCSGRILTGIISDSLGKHFNTPRIYGLITGVSLIFISQLFVATGLIHNLDSITFATTLLGLGYGAVFSALPAIVSLFFGRDKFGANWGWFQWAPAVGGQAANLLFGAVMDASGGGEEGGGGCSGASCFYVAFCVTSIGCVVSAALLVIVALRRQ